jgi:hypothetical protein
MPMSKILCKKVLEVYPGKEFKEEREIEIGGGGKVSGRKREGGRKRESGVCVRERFIE